MPEPAWFDPLEEETVLHTDRTTVRVGMIEVTLILLVVTLLYFIYILFIYFRTGDAGVIVQFFLLSAFILCVWFFFSFQKCEEKEYVITSKRVVCSDGNFMQIDEIVKISRNLSSLVLKSRWRKLDMAYLQHPKETRSMIEGLRK